MPRSSSIASAREQSDDAGESRDDKEQDERPTEDTFPRGVAHRPEQVSLAGATERPGLERQAPFLDIGQRRKDHRTDQRDEAADPGTKAALGVEAAGPLALGDHGSTLDKVRYGLDRGDRDEREARGDPAPLGVEDERPRFGRQDEQTDRQRDGDETDDRLRGEVDALEGRVERSDHEQDR